MEQRKREKEFGEYALSHWVEKRHNVLVLLSGRESKELARLPVDKNVSEMQQHAELLSWGFDNQD